MEKLVLITGAGASKALHNEFGLGWELIRDIADRVTDRTSPENPNLSKLLNRLKFNYSVRSHFLKCLEDYRNAVGVTASIDGFMDEVGIYPEFTSYKDEFERIAKYMVVSHVLGYEGELKKSIAQNGPIQNSWIDHLANYIHKVGPDMAASNLKIITFNYDRTIQHLLYTHPLFAGNETVLVNFLKNNIVHVYGRIGPLTWEEADDAFDFGEENDRYEKIYRQKNAIQLMYSEREWSENSDRHDKIHCWIHNNPTTIAACGFNFDLVNYRRLELQNLVSGSQKLIANVYPNASMQFESRRDLTTRIREVKHDAEITCLTCDNFIKYVLT